MVYMLMFGRTRAGINMGCTGLTGAFHTRLAQQSLGRGGATTLRTKAACEQEHPFF